MCIEVYANKFLEKVVKRLFKTFFTAVSGNILTI